MTSSVRIRSTTGDCADPYRWVQFWSRLTGLAEDPGNPHEPGDLDLVPPERGRDAEVGRVLRLGAQLVDDRRWPDGTGWVVLADPEGNESCIERSDAERAR